MPNLLKSLIRHSLFAGDGNLASSDEPYSKIAKLLSGHTVTNMIDAGASNGRISKRMLRLFPNANVYAFEPNPLYTETLNQEAKQDAHFKPQFYALSDKEHTVDLQITESPGSTSLFKPGGNLRRMYPAETEIRAVKQVQALMLDKWAQQCGISDIELMKFDIQGGELCALRGASELLERSTLLVYTEILFNPLYEGGAIYSEIDQFLRSHGFILYDIFKPRYDGKGLLMWGNAIFLHPGRLTM